MPGSSQQDGAYRAIQSIDILKMIPASPGSVGCKTPAKPTMKTLGFDRPALAGFSLPGSTEHLGLVRPANSHVYLNGRVVLRQAYSCDGRFKQMRLN